MRAKRKGDLTLYEFEQTSLLPVTTFVTTRETDDGNTSDARGNFNTGLFCGDCEATVENNLQRLCHALHISRERLVYPHQTHGAKVTVIDSAFFNLPANLQKERLDGTDALITNQTETAIAVTTADCVPILLYDPVQKAAAAIHAGWRGTVQQIVRHTLEAMQQRYGCRPEEIYAAIAPCIGGDAYEVGDEVAEAFAQSGYDLKKIAYRHATSGKYHIDLAAANADLLLRNGVSLDRLEVSGLCTYTLHDTFYSVRALGADTGRILTGILIHNE